MGQVGRLGPKVGGHLALLLHSSREPGELLQCSKHDDSTINIVVVIIIIIIIIIINGTQENGNKTSAISYRVDNTTNIHIP